VLEVMVTDAVLPSSFAMVTELEESNKVASPTF
jgi:hypothetical protein